MNKPVVCASIFLRGIAYLCVSRLNEEGEWKNISGYIPLTVPVVYSPGEVLYVLAKTPAELSQLTASYSASMIAAQSYLQGLLRGKLTEEARERALYLQQVLEAQSL
jgi:hypothetical protein